LVECTFIFSTGAVKLYTLNEESVMDLGVRLATSLKLEGVQRATNLINQGDTGVLLAANLLHIPQELRFEMPLLKEYCLAIVRTAQNQIAIVERGIVVGKKVVAKKKGWASITGRVSHICPVKNIITITHPINKPRKISIVKWTVKMIA
jgi:hypothetical protein